MAGGLVYHWRHGWIPRTPTAALQKAHGSRKGADKIMAKHGIKGDLPGGHHNATPHAAPHTLKPGDHATVHGKDEFGSDIHFTGTVRGNTAVHVGKGAKRTPMRSIAVEHTSATTGRNRIDHVNVPDPNRDPARIQAAREAGSARDQIRRDLMAKYKGQGSSYMQQTRGIDPAVMSDADLKKLGDSLHAEHDMVLLSDGKKLRAEVDAEIAKRASAPKVPTKPKADTSRARVRDLPPEGTADAPSASSKRVQIDHSGDGTTLTIDRNDAEARQAAKDAGFRWSSNLGAWYLPRTQHESTRRAKVAQLQRKLGEANVHVDDGGRGQTTTAAEREAAARAAAAARASRMDTRASRLQAESDSRRAASNAITDQIPMGQPILVGHHSQRRHERALERAHSNDVKSWEAQKAADQARQSADTARRAAEGDSPLLRQRRIDRNEAEIRKIDRELSDHQLASKIPTDSPLAGRVAHMRASQNRLDQLQTRRAELADQVAHDKAQIAASGKKTYTAADLSAGDIITYRGRAYVVKKVNKTTVSVPTGYSWDDKVPLNQITQHAPLTSMKTESIKKALGNTKDPKLKAAFMAELRRRGESIPA